MFLRRLRENYSLKCELSQFAVQKNNYNLYFNEKKTRMYFGNSKLLFSIIKIKMCFNFGIKDF